MAIKQWQLQAKFEELSKLAPPPLGDSQLFWTVQLTEPEINALHYAVNFVRSACLEMDGAWRALYTRHWAHYGPSLEELSNRLAAQTEGPQGDPGTSHSELLNLLRDLLPYAEQGLPARPHVGACGPEAGCDGSCIELANAGSLFRRVHALLHERVAAKEK